jgi:hypothetical protein
MGSPIRSRSSLAALHRADFDSNAPDLRALTIARGRPLHPAAFSQASDALSIRVRSRRRNPRRCPPSLEWVIRDLA